MNTSSVRLALLVEHQIARPHDFSVATSSAVLSIIPAPLRWDRHSVDSVSVPFIDLLGFVLYLIALTLPSQSANGQQRSLRRSVFHLYPLKSCPGLILKIRMHTPGRMEMSEAHVGEEWLPSIYVFLDERYRSFGCFSIQ